MSDDGTEWEGEDELPERPYGARPYGARPYGARPYGARPYGARPYGARPYGARPYGARPYGARPYGARPYGARPYGARPYGARPYGARPVGADDGAGGFLDPDEWGAEIAELVCERSAVIRLGASIASADDQLWIPAFGASAGFRPGVPKLAAAAPGMLRPRDNALEAMVAVPDALVARIAENPELGDALKFDLGAVLGRGADGAFLVGPALPGAVSGRARIRVPTAKDLLSTLRAMVAAILGRDPLPAFRSPGWILHPASLDRVTRLRTEDGLTESNKAASRSLASFQLLRLESADSGMLLGFPFVTSTQALDGAGKPRIYFAADWQEAWIGVDPYFVTVDLPGAPTVADATVIRASMSLDFTLRREDAFAWADSP